eukprot:XP_001708882.1 Hypothetical protein GL50803_103988 [Giardia lamblia ATCC 50803]
MALLCGDHQSSTAVLVSSPTFVRGKNFNYLRVVVVCGVHECSPAVLVLEAPLFLNKQLDGISVPLLVALINTESFFKQHPDGLCVIRVRGTHQPGQQKEAGLRASHIHSVIELCKPTLQCLNHS